MEIDRKLIKLSKPVIRFYKWDGDWVSYGYFQSLEKARALFGEEVDYVRRWTGGGIVDHRGDETYTLVIPSSEKAAGLRGDEGYRAIHEAVVAYLRANGPNAELISND